MTRNEKILSMRGKMSYTLIGRKLDVTRNIVAGVCWRADHSGCAIKRKHEGLNYTIGTGHHGKRGKSAPQNLFTERQE